MVDKVEVVVDASKFLSLCFLIKLIAYRFKGKDKTLKHFLEQNVCICTRVCFEQYGVHNKIYSNAYKNMYIIQYDLYNFINKHKVQIPFIY